MASPSQAHQLSRYVLGKARQGKALRRQGHGACHRQKKVMSKTITGLLLHEKYLDAAEEQGVCTKVLPTPQLLHKLPAGGGHRGGGAGQIGLLEQASWRDRNINIRKNTNMKNSKKEKDA